MVLGAYLVLPVQDQTGHQMGSQKTFSPTINNIYCIPVLVARPCIRGWRHKFRQGAILLHLVRRRARKEIIPTGGRAKQVARRGVPKLLYEHGERMNTFCVGAWGRWPTPLPPGSNIYFGLHL